MYSFAPDVYAVPPHQDGIGIGILVHGLLEELREVFLVGRVLDYGDPQGIMVSQVPRLQTAPEALDLLDVVDAELAITPGTQRLEEQRDEHRPLRVGVDAAAGPPLREGRQEQRRALRRLVLRRAAQVDSVASVERRGLRGE